MSFSLARDVLLHYSRSGGAPPASLDVLVVREDGNAVYLAGNPWPQQPPFDEIGWYAATLPAELLEAMRAGVHAVAADPATAGAASADSGVEFFAVRADGRVVTVRYGAERVPAGVEAARIAAHAAIGSLRAHPLRTLSARVALDDRPGGRLVVELQNRGREPFALYGPTAAGAELEVRVAGRKSEGGRSAHTAAPEWLVGRDPLPLIALQGGVADATLHVSAGGTITLTLDAAGLDATGATVLECLIRVCFPREDRDGKPFVQEGWILAPAIPLEAAVGRAPKTVESGS